MLVVEMDQEEDNTLKEEMGERRWPVAILMKTENQTYEVVCAVWTQGNLSQEAMATVIYS